ncbi:MAG: leucyl/phenylalanyl-tRNA--protein transferase [Candidatus Methylacidiphilales bacterium]
MLRNDDTPLPDARQADPEGLVAIGGALSPSRLIEAYRKGIFPWSEDPVTWWSPPQRAVFLPISLRLQKSLIKVLRRSDFTLTYDRAFAEVIASCACRPKNESTWIGPVFIEGYTSLHHLGVAHSVECWQGEKLVGGLYGLAIGGLFAGESMFHRTPHASKACLLALCHHLNRQGYDLIDSQVPNRFTLQMGARMIDRRDYLGVLKSTIDRPVHFDAPAESIAASTLLP